MVSKDKMSRITSFHASQLGFKVFFTVSFMGVSFTSNEIHQM